MAKTRDLSKIAARGVDVSKKRQINPFDVGPIQSTELLLTEVKDRPKGNTRPIDPEHVKDLAENIKSLGLIQPIAVDKYNYLIAGGHRLEAFRLLKKEKIQVHRMVDIDAVSRPDEAKRTEIAENEKRKDYNGKELKGLKKHLLETGSYAEIRTKANREIPMINEALILISGKSKAQINKLLKKEELGGSNEPPKKKDRLKEDLNLKKAIVRWQGSIKLDGKGVPENELYQKIFSNATEWLNCYNEISSNLKTEPEIN